MSSLFDRIREALQDRYLVLEELGQGAAAIVYLAEDRKHHRQVALKVLRPEVAADVGAERFIREIETVAQLSHPHILPLFDSGETDGLPWFVMPYMPGESLRAHLAREHQLSVDEALEITRDVAGALGYAHSLGIVHRDIKPGNILLSGGRAIVADFGVARAISAAREGEVEQAAELFGTPLYMSPEQFTGSVRVDRRSDLYSLGCVLYEMLVGEPPFTGPTAEALRAQHVTQAPPSLRDSHRNVESGLVDVVDRLLAKAPADRFVTAQQLVDELPALARSSGRISGSFARRGLRRRWMVPAGVAAIAAVAGTVYALNRPDPAIPGRYAVASEGPQAGQDSRYVAAAASVLGSLDELSVARDVEVIDEVQSEGAPANVEDLLHLGRRLRAERLVRLTSRAATDSLTFALTLYHLRDRDTAPVTESVRCVPGPACEEAVGRATRRLILLGTGYRDDGAPGTASLAAYLSFARGMHAYGAWDLAQAESLLTNAVALDPGFARAQQNLAEVQWWLARPRHEWHRRAAEALRLGHELGPREEARSRALVALGEERYLDACTEFDALIARDSADFAAWYGKGECLRRDQVVIRDRDSPSGWRFRSSVEAATRSFERAMQLAPGIHRAFGARAYERTVSLFYVNEYRYRPGYIEQPRPRSDSLAFAAWPDLAADTLVFVPWPFTETMAFEPRTRAQNQWRAILRSRSRMASMTEEWVRKFPSSPIANLTRAEALESLREGGQESGWREVLDYALTARRLAAGDPVMTNRAAATEVRLRLKAQDFIGATALADSLLASVQTSDTSVVRYLASVAALTGRISQAVDLAAEGARDFQRIGAGGQKYVMPVPLSAAALSLLVYSSFGAPADSVRALEQRVDDMLPGFVPPAQLADARATVLERPATLAFGTLGPRPAHAREATWTNMRMQRAFIRGDRAALAADFQRGERDDSHWRRSSTNLDAELLQAHLLIKVGDTAQVVRRLSLSLESFAGYGRDLLASDIEGSLPQMAALPQLMALRADLAARDRDMQTARRWARAVTILWKNADAELQPTVDRMRAMLTSAPATPD